MTGEHELGGGRVRMLVGDALEVLRGMPDQSVDCCVTSPPYWGLRSYLPDDHVAKGKEIGLERTPEEYVQNLVAVFQEVKRVLVERGVLWLNLGDCYCTVPHGPKGSNSSDPKVPVARERKGTQSNRLPQLGVKHKDLVGVPWRVAFALQADGWILRQDVIWNKPACMPESVKDRCTRSHEYLFMLAKSPRYYYDQQAVAEPAVTRDRAAWTDRGAEKQRGHSRRHAGFNGRYAQRVMEQGAPQTRNRRSVWTIATVPYKGAHFAVFPPELACLCILSGCPSAGVVLDPFGGSGTVGRVAFEHGRRAVLIDVDERNVPLAEERLRGVQMEI